jgi:protein-S-isoprenylcysteine O-methyltransferase Ste14
VRFLVRYRVALGFASAIAAFALAKPTPTSLALGLAVAVAGEAIRIWAAGHLEKGTEITTSGPYRIVRHPLYLGSALMGIGFMVAARDLVVTLLVSAYLALTLTAAIRSEEALLDDRFQGGYSAWRGGGVVASTRRFSLERVLANREYRAMLGLAAGMSVLFWRTSW